MQSLPDCHSRRPWDDEYCFCAHPQVHVRDNLASAAVCQACTRWSDPPPAKFRSFPVNVRQCRSGPCQHLGEQTGLRVCKGCPGDVRVKVFECLHPDRPEETTIRDCRGCGVYERRLERGGAVCWEVAVIGSQGEATTLQRTLASVEQAGFSAPRVAAAAAPTPGSEAHQGGGLGPWARWYLALTELYFRNPHADVYLMLQGGAVLRGDARASLEAALWPAPRLGMVSLSGDEKGGGAAGFVPWRNRHENIRPAALVLPGSSVRSLLVCPLALQEDPAPSPAGAADRAIQHRLARWLVRSGLDCLTCQQPLAFLSVDGSRDEPAAAAIARATEHYTNRG